MLAVIILAIVQGIAEFLPISSSAHLIIFRELFGIGKDVITENMALTFDVALHFGTLIVIVAYFFKDFWNMVVKGLTKGPKDPEGKLLWQVIVATIPAALMGALFEDYIEDVFRSKYVVMGFILIIVGIIIYIIDKKSKETNSVKKMTYLDALIIGCSQIVALLPGCSRSGSTIGAGRALKMKREDSFKFSFYLSAPIVLGSVALKMFKLIKADELYIITDNLSYFLVGITVSCLVGFLVINFLFKYIKNHDFKAFMIYRIIMGIIVILCAILK